MFRTGDVHCCIISIKQRVFFEHYIILLLPFHICLSGQLVEGVVGEGSLVPYHSTSDVVEPTN